MLTLFHYTKNIDFRIWKSYKKYTPFDQKTIINFKNMEDISLEAALQEHHNKMAEHRERLRARMDVATFGAN